MIYETRKTVFDPEKRVENTTQGSFDELDEVFGNAVKLCLGGLIYPLDRTTNREKTEK